MYQIIRKYLKRMGVEYSLRNNNQVIDFEVEAPEGKWNCMLLLHHKSAIGFYSVLPITVPESMRSELVLHLMYLNNDRIFGNFELDVESGEIRFKTYIDCDSTELTERILDRTMLINVATMQKYLPQLQNKIRQTKAA